jgi:hypothetical protein
MAEFPRFASCPTNALKRPQSHAPHETAMVLARAGPIKQFSCAPTRSCPSSKKQ